MLAFATYIYLPPVSSSNRVFHQHKIMAKKCHIILFVNLTKENLLLIHLHGHFSRGERIQKAEGSAWIKCPDCRGHDAT